MTKPRYRLAIDAPLQGGADIVLRDNPAHYVAQVLRMKAGDTLALFNKKDGEWVARIAEVKKRELVLVVMECLRPPSARGMNLMVCFAPIKGGRMETIIEKATELGAAVLQPVITARTIVDKVNLDRAEAIAREAAEQCERIDWPEIREPVKLARLLGDWPADMPLIYGDESGASSFIFEGGLPPFAPCGADPAASRLAQSATHDNHIGRAWGILAGPEGGFTPEEFAALAHVKAARGVGLGPRILRADTAVITLCALTLAAWGDWDARPRFEHSTGA